MKSSCTGIKKSQTAICVLKHLQETKVLGCAAVMAQLSFPFGNCCERFTCCSVVYVVWKRLCLCLWLLSNSPDIYCQTNKTKASSATWRPDLIVTEPLSWVIIFRVSSTLKFWPHSNLTVRILSVFIKYFIK